MIKDKYHTITDIEIFLQNYDCEFQSVGNEIKIYLDESEIYIVIDKYINIYDHGEHKPCSFLSLDKAMEKLKSIIS